MVVSPSAQTLRICVFCLLLFSSQGLCCHHLRRKVAPHRNERANKVTCHTPSHTLIRLVQMSKILSQEIWKKKKANPRSLPLYEVSLQVLISSPVCYYLLFWVPLRHALCTVCPQLLSSSVGEGGRGTLAPLTWDWCHCLSSITYNLLAAQVLCLIIEIYSLSYSLFPKETIL